MFPDIADYEAATGQCRQPRPVYMRILLRHVITDPACEDISRLLHECDRKPFPGTAMIEVMIPATLWKEIEGTSIPSVESLRLELLWPLPGSRIVVGPIQVKKHSSIFRKSIAVPFERLPCPRSHGREEGVIPANLLDE